LTMAELGKKSVRKREEKKELGCKETESKHYKIARDGGERRGKRGALGVRCRGKKERYSRRGPGGEGTRERSGEEEGNSREERKKREGNAGG